MRERPIIFNADMVRTVLDGRKTQTRRIMKNQPVPSKTREGDFWFSCNKMCSMVHVSDFIPGNCANLPDAHEFFSMCSPFGAVGDRLWVRETWMPDAPRDGTWGDVEFYGCKGSPLSMIPECYRTPEHCIHRAGWDGHELVGWKPSIHMPRWASRITLEINGVRVERLQDISEGDAKAEGLAEITKDGSLFKFGIPDRDGYPGTDDNGWSWTEWERNPVDAYRKLWQSIYGADSWQANPWVWVIEFKRVEVE